MILYMSPCLRDCECIPEHPLRAVAPMEVLVDEADADPGNRLLGHPATRVQPAAGQRRGMLAHTEQIWGQAGSRQSSPETRTCSKLIMTFSQYKYS